MATYSIILRDGDKQKREQQKADRYIIHPTGYHIFMKKGRVVRAISSATVLEVKEE